MFGDFYSFYLFYFILFYFILFFFFFFGGGVYDFVAEMCTKDWIALELSLIMAIDYDTEQAICNADSLSGNRWIES